MIEVLSREGITVAKLKAFYAAERTRHRLAEQTISALAQLDAEEAWRATCLLRLMALDGKLSSDVIVRLCAEADGLEHWVARLNVCQILAVVPCPPAAHEDALPFLETCCADSHGTIRAWAYSALARLPLEGPAWERVMGLFLAGRRDAAKCVQARFRCDKQLAVWGRIRSSTTLKETPPSSSSRPRPDIRRRASFLRS